MMKWIKKISPARLVFLIILIAGNTFAWFIYTTKIDSSISVHVKSWDVVFKAGDEEISSNVSINISSVYPGMETYVNEVSAYNKSEVPATLGYRVLEATILGDEYVTPEGRNERGEEALPTDPSNEELIRRLGNDYPFRIVFAVSNQTVNAVDGEEKYSFRVEWPFEQNNDELDTFWGIKAAQYKKDNPSLSSITLKVKLVITQNPD